MRRIPDKIRTALPVAMLLLLSCSSSLTDRVKAYEASHNSHDVEGTLAFFAEDFRYEMVGSWVAEGREQMRKFEEWDASIGSELIFDNYDVSGDTVTCTVIERNDWFSLVGVDAIYYECVRIIFKDGLITEITAEQSHESMLATQTAFQAFIEWAVEEHPQRLAALMSGAKFEFSKETADKWLSLLKEWRQQLRQFDRITRRIADRKSSVV
ncbi:MAG: nuclear transport factor 2 family protein [candidate division Zixibacteria bacterium]|nr:nuclear transport factor 2 family protein [candidate division Zixibacteria bacterium]MBU1471679.1 nuclear transport factor 2 family protein [candidate division Zixibacteria bacterium]MBU2625425.1 nuclear transport factor 2 family protein [candidate division Zixibacteria bacterium]